jgi:anti-anti-sigma factor
MSIPKLQLKESKKGDFSILALSGELDAKTTPEFKAHLDKMIQGGSRKVILDCSELSYIASAGIGAMNASLKSIQAMGGGLCLAKVQKQIRDTLDLMYFTKKVKLYGTVDEAISAFGS